MYQEEDDFLQAVEEEVRRYSTSKQSEIQALKRMETYRKEFIGNVSRAQNAHFNAQGYIETLLMGGRRRSEYNVLGKATRNLDRLANIEDLIMLNQYETDTTQLDIQSFDITELTKQVMDEQELLASKILSSSLKMIQAFNVKSLPTESTFITCCLTSSITPLSTDMRMV